jgi:mycothiol maleylpyruvate isomerase-like protein
VRQRIDALEAVWERWAEVGGGLAEAEWSTPSRCTGWDVAALFAHVGVFPHAVLDAPLADGGDPVTAVDILRGFNAPSGVAHTMAGQVAKAAVALAARVGRPGLVAFFADTGPRGIAALRKKPADGLVPWPAAAAVTTWVEAVRIVLLESVVHLLGRAPDLPAEALRETAHLLADLADPVAFVEAATGRSAGSPLPVLR